jgi:hypothetical protein
MTYIDNLDVNLEVTLCTFFIMVWWFENTIDLMIILVDD